jgi:hypothetical protein
METETNGRTFHSSQQTWANYISFRGLTYLASKGLKAGLNVAGKIFRNTANADGGMFPRGIEGTSRKVRDGSIPPQEQSDEEDETEAFSIPEAATIDPEEFSGRKLSKESDELGIRDSESTSLVDSAASPRTKYMDLMNARVNQAKFAMDRCLEDILALNKTSEELSQQIEALSKQAADIKEEASQAECSASKWSAWGQCILTLGGILGTLGSLPLPAALAAVSPIGATIGAIVGAGLISYSCVRKGQAALKTCESEKKQAVVQTQRDTQGIIGTKISICQNKFSTLSQEYNTLISIWQSMISAENEARRAIINNIR